MNPFEILKDKLAYFGGYKWLPYVDAVELVEENQRLKQLIESLKNSNNTKRIKIDEYQTVIKQTIQHLENMSDPEDSYEDIHRGMVGWLNGVLEGEF